MSKRLTLYMASYCDHCEWVEQLLRNKELDADVWDCKNLLHHPGVSRATNRETGVKVNIAIPAVPFLLDETNDPPLAIFGAEAILAHVGGTKIMLPLAAVAEE